MGNFAHARNLVQPVQLVAPGSPLAPAQMFRNLLRENRSPTSMGFMARASRQKCVAQMRCLGPVPVAGVPISTGAADSRRSCRLRPARPVVRRRGQRRPAAKAADCAPLGAMEAAREGASDPDFRSHAALLADPGGGGVSPVEGWLSRLANAPGFQSAPHRMENGGGGGCSPGFRRRSARTSTPPTRFCGRGALPLQDPLRVAALAARSGWTAGR